MNDLNGARKLADKLKSDNGFYETACQTAKRNFNAFFGEEEYTYNMKEVIKKVMLDDKK